jgi:demethylmenaquinone methyltransferase/2-methoxy-6-polyprenyl-1,4-benzoquinol methylase
MGNNHPLRGQLSYDDILPVSRSRSEAKQFYDRVSRIYDHVTGSFERRISEKALSYLCIHAGETLLEIGFGTGHILERMAELVGDEGWACGLDLSSGMAEKAKSRLENARLLHRAGLSCGDALRTPFRKDVFDAVLMNFTLELFDTPDIPVVLREIKRSLKVGGRLGVASLSRIDGSSLMLRLYERAHMMWPTYVDCRPIHVERALSEAGFQTTRSHRDAIYGLPVEIVVAHR